MTQKGFFWKSTAMILSGAPLRIAGPVMSGAPMPRRALPDGDDGVLLDGRATGHEVDRREAAVGVVALLVGDVLAGELHVLDPGELVVEGAQIRAAAR